MLPILPLLIATYSEVIGAHLLETRIVNINIRLRQYNFHESGPDRLTFTVRQIELSVE